MASEKVQKSLAKELGKCAGMWVATDDEHVIACGKTIKEVREKTARKQVENLRIFSVPDIKKGHLYY